jgi:hypothetical protein
MKSQGSEQRESKVFERSLISNGKVLGLEELIQARIKRSQSNYNRNSVNFKTVTSMIKDYKLEGP